MTEFKVGDRVKLVGETWTHLEGQFATVVEPYKYGNGYWLLRVDDFPYNDSEEEKDGHPAIDSEIDFVSRPLSAVDPDYYKFPGGIEVRQISAHLTSFGGQALQYIARSTRLDGKNKGDSVENLRKAIAFLNWEIERLENP